MRKKVELFANVTWTEGEDKEKFGTSVDCRFDVVEFYSGRIIMVQSWEKNKDEYSKECYQVLFHEDGSDYALVRYIGWPDSDI